LLKQKTYSPALISFPTVLTLLYAYSPTGSFAKSTVPEIRYDTVDKPGTRVVPHQSSASGVEYAVSTKTASMASLNEKPPEYVYVAVDKKKVITN